MLSWCEVGTDALFIGDMKGHVWSWSLADGQCSHIGAFGSRVVTLRQVESSLFIGLLDGRLVRCNVDGSAPLSVTAHKGCLSHLASHGSFLATAGSDGKARVWNHDLKQVYSIGSGETKRPIISVTFFGSPDSLVIGERSGFFEIWKDRGNESLAGGHIFKHGGVSAISVFPDLSAVIFGCTRGGRVELECETWKSRNSRRDPPKPIAVNAFAWSRDGEVLATACSDDSIRLKRDSRFEMNAGTPFYTKRPNPGWKQAFVVSSVCFGADGTLYAAVFDDTVRVFDTGRYKPACLLQRESRMLRSDKLECVDSDRSPISWTPRG